MYYKLQSCSTLNIYELPCTIDSLWKTDGSSGWTGHNVMALSDYMGKKDSMMGKVMSMVTGMGQAFVDRVRINYMPRWDADAGTHTGSAEVTV